MKSGEEDGQDARRLHRGGRPRGAGPSSTSCRARSSSTARCRSSSRPTSTRCPSSSTRETGRIHATFNQTVAATGRISASDPNLQNIPIRTAEGRRIREAFVAEPGHLLLSADYSQIELRVLAHLSKDPTLIDTFRRGRRRARPHLARDLRPPLRGPPGRAAAHLQDGQLRAPLREDRLHAGQGHRGLAGRRRRPVHPGLLRALPAVRAFIDETIASARETGMVRTLLGRLRRLPDLRAKNFQVRMEAERQAMNTPVQGSAADLIKKAMIDLAPRAAARAGCGSRLILQIHDELLLEVPEDEAETARGAGEGDDGGRARRWTCRSWPTRASGRTGPRCTNLERSRAFDDRPARSGNIQFGGHLPCPSTSTSAPSAAASS